MYNTKITKSLERLISYSLSEKLAGYDPYDGLNSDLGKFTIGKSSYLPLIFYQIFNITSIHPYF